MSDIQSISQGNYILHNIDAKKLYVQEPLFTANSGDAVYVGWRPDETVLYDNYGNNTDLQLSESPLNFNQIELYCKGSNINGDNEAWGSMKIDNEQLSSTNYVMVNGGFCGGCSSPTTGNTYVMYALYTGCSGTNWKKTFGMATRGSYIDAANSGHFFIYKVIGVNRKENA